MGRINQKPEALFVLFMAPVLFPHIISLPLTLYSIFMRYLHINLFILKAQRNGRKFSHILQIKFKIKD